MNSAISNISSLPQFYENGDVMQKRHIVGSIYPEKLTFDGLNFRTSRLKDALSLMLLITNKIEVKKMGQIRIFLTCPIR